MPRSRKILLLLGLAIALIAVCGFMAWKQWRTHRTYYSDGQNIRQPLNRAVVRDVIWGPPAALPVTINTDAGEREGRLSADGLMLFFVRGKPGENADLYVSLRLSETATGQQWSDPEPLATLNTFDDELGPEPSRDGRSLLFYSNRPEGVGGFDIWVSMRSDNGFEPPINLGPAINSEFDESNPALSPQGDQIVFASNRPRGHEKASRDWNLYSSMIGADGSFSPAVALDELNTAANDSTPAFSPAGDFLYFASDRKSSGGLGGFDLFRARIVRGEIQAPTNLGAEINTASNERDPSPCLDGFGLHFSSDRVPISASGGAAAEPQSDLYYTTSREVFREVEPARAINWASIAALLLPAIIWALIGSLAIVALLMMLRRMRTGQMSLLARCLLASLAAHLALLIMLTFWQVTSSIVDVMEQEGLMQVAIATSSAGGGDELFTQVRGGLTSIELSAEAGAIARAQAEMPRAETAGAVQLDAQMMQLAFDDRQAERSEMRDAPAVSQLPPDVEKPETPAGEMSAQVVTPQVAPPARSQETALTARAAELAPSDRDRSADAIPAASADRSRIVAMAPVNDASKTSDERSVAAAMQANDAKLATPPVLQRPELANETLALQQVEQRLALSNPPTEALQKSLEATTTIAAKGGAAPRVATSGAIDRAQPTAQRIEVAPQAVAAETAPGRMAASMSQKPVNEAGVPRSGSKTELPAVAVSGATDAAVAVPTDQRMAATTGDASVVLQASGQSAARQASSAGADTIAAGPARDSQVQLAPRSTPASSNESTMARTDSASISDSAIQKSIALSGNPTGSNATAVDAAAVSAAQLSIPVEQDGGQGTDAAVVLKPTRQTTQRAAAGSGSGGGGPLASGPIRDGSVQIAPQQSSSMDRGATLAAVDSALKAEAAIDKSAAVSGAAMGSPVGDVQHAAISGDKLATPGEQIGVQGGNAEPAVGIGGATAGNGAIRRADTIGSSIAVKSGDAHLVPATMPDSLAIGGDGNESRIGPSMQGAQEAAVPKSAGNGLLALTSIAEIGAPSQSIGNLSLPQGGGDVQRGDRPSSATVVLAGASGSSTRVETTSATLAVSGSSPKNVQLDPNQSTSIGGDQTSLAQSNRIREGQDSLPTGAATNTPATSSGLINLPAVAMTGLATPAEQSGGRGGEVDAQARLPSPQASPSTSRKAAGDRAFAAALGSGTNSKSANLAPERGGKHTAGDEPWILMTDKRINDAPQSIGGGNGKGPQVANLGAPSMTAVALDLHIPKEVAPVPSSYVQRSEDLRQKVVKQMGGSEATEKAVALALKWFANHQSADGRWAAKGFDSDCDDCGGAAKFDTDVAATALALMCFLAADHTHIKEGPYQTNVARALAWLKTQQKDDGDFRGGETMYSHGIATIAIAEAYGMTNDHGLGMPIKKSIDYIAAALNTRVGGWRYEPGQAGDTSVLGWQIMAMTSAKRAGIPVPDELFKAAGDWMNVVDTPGSPGLYSYQPGQRYSASMTAEGMFVQQLAGRDHNDPRMRASAEYIMQNLPRWSTDPNTYYWYYATLALFQHQGNAWTTWNKNLTHVLLANQEKSGAAAGSWDPLDNWSKIGGRVYQTAMCTLCLEVYYRYLPMYAAVEREDEKANGGE